MVEQIRKRCHPVVTWLYRLIQSNFMRLINDRSISQVICCKISQINQIYRGKQSVYRSVLDGHVDRGCGEAPRRNAIARCSIPEREVLEVRPLSQASAPAWA
jgi:hypothetical protein